MVKMRSSCTLTLWQCQQEAVDLKSFSQPAQQTNFLHKTIQPKWMVRADQRSLPSLCKLTNDHMLHLRKSKNGGELGHGQPHARNQRLRCGYLRKRERNGPITIEAVNACFGVFCDWREYHPRNTTTRTPR